MATKTKPDEKKRQVKLLVDEEFYRRIRLACDLHPVVPSVPHFVRGCIEDGITAAHKKYGKVRVSG
jgi:hypothetical protein